MADLTSVARVRLYAPLANNPTLTGTIQALISAESQTIQNYINIAVPFESLADVLMDGRGALRLMLPRTPVIAVQALSVLGQAQDAVMDPRTVGYLADTRRGTIELTPGRRFPEALSSVQCTWTAGFPGSQATAIPVATGNATTTTITPTANTDGGFAAVVANVVSAGGVVFTSAANQSNPLATEYGFADGVFTFNTTDSNTVVTMTYYCVPGPLMMACNEQVATDLQMRQNVGMGFKSLAGETLKYDWKQLTDIVKAQLAPYRRWTPA